MKGILIAVFTLTLLIPAAVYAQADLQSEQTADSTAQTTDAVDDSTSRERLQDRLDDYKQRVEERLSLAEERRIARLCTNAQAVVARLESNLASARENRSDAYSGIYDRLNSLVEKLDAASIDTTELNRIILSFKEDSDEVVAKVEAYQQIVNDLIAMDCQEDPAAFKAALDIARQERNSLVNLSSTFKNSFKEAIKAELQNIRQSLSNSSGEES